MSHVLFNVYSIVLGTSLTQNQTLRSQMSTWVSFASDLVWILRKVRKTYASNIRRIKIWGQPIKVTVDVSDILNSGMLPGASPW